MGGIGSGRTLAPETVFKQTLARAHEKLPAVMDALISRALSAPCKCPKCGDVFPLGPGDREAQIYVIDRCLGRPKQELSIEQDTTITLQPGDYSRLALLQLALKAVDVPAHVVEIPQQATPEPTQPDSSD